MAEKTEDTEGREVVSESGGFVFYSDGSVEDTEDND